MHASTVTETRKKRKVSGSEVLEGQALVQSLLTDEKMNPGLRRIKAGSLTEQPMFVVIFS